MWMLLFVMKNDEEVKLIFIVIGNININMVV